MSKRAISFIFLISFLLVGGLIALTFKKPPQSTAILPTLAQVPDMPSGGEAANNTILPTTQSLPSQTPGLDAELSATTTNNEPIAAPDVATETAKPVLLANAAITPSNTQNSQVMTLPIESVPNVVVVSLANEADRAAFVAQVQAQGGTITSKIDALNSFVVSLPQNMNAADLTQGITVANTEPDYYVVAANDPLMQSQYALDMIGAPQAWDAMPANTPPVVIAVIDSGVDANHPDLAGKIVAQHDFLQNDDIAQDEFGHGTEVSGIIAAAHNDIGIAGIAPNAQIMALRVLDASGRGRYSDVAAAIIYAADHDAKVINLSLGGANDSDLLRSAIDYAINKGLTVVAAAGNQGASQPMEPARYAPVIAVGAVDETGAVASFSNQGADVLAPGVNILTTILNNDYGVVSGTSFAAPMVSAGLSIGYTLPSNFEQTAVFKFADTISATPLPSAEAPHDLYFSGESIDEVMRQSHILSTPESSVPENDVSGQSAYNATAAVNWARSNISYPNRGVDWGSNPHYQYNRYCTNFVATSLNQGGLNTDPGWTGNQQLVQWMWYNQDQWEFRNLNELVPGDFVFYGYDVYNGNSSNWMDTDPTATGNGYQYGPNVNFQGWSRFAHVAFVTGSGLVSAWNAEYLDVSMTGWYTGGLNARLGIHIKSESSPSAPTNLAFSNATRTSLSLTWTDTSNNETGFYVKRRLLGGSFTTIATLGANVTSYVDTGVVCGTNYEYVVSSYNSAGVAQSAQVGRATLPCLPTVTLLAPAANATVTTNRPTLSWQAVPGATSYQLEIDAGTGPFLNMRTISLSSATLSYPLTFNLMSTNYKWRVRPIFGADIGDWSTRNFTVNDVNTVPSAWYYNTATPTITWTTVNNALDYQLTIDDGNPATPPLIINNIAGLQYAVPAQLDGSYTYAVRARLSATTFSASTPVDTFIVDVR
ncbi:MAG: S8 family serine peptidase [Chloroflexota bacterium]